MATKFSCIRTENTAGRNRRTVYTTDIIARPPFSVTPELGELLLGGPREQINPDPYRNEEMERFRDDNRYEAEILGLGGDYATASHIQLKVRVSMTDAKRAETIKEIVMGRLTSYAAALALGDQPLCEALNSFAARPVTEAYVTQTLEETPNGR